MLLEEALACNSNINAANPTQSPNAASPSSTTLSPHGEALAILSFIQDELPAGGTAAEKRFVNLFLLIVNRIFGQWNIATPEGSSSSSLLSPRNNDGGGGGVIRPPVTTSPGGSTYSSPGTPSSSSPSGGQQQQQQQQRDYHHAEGGWLGLPSSPPSQRSGNNNNNSNNNNRIRTPSSSSSNSSRTAPLSLDHDPIVRLLRAPRRQQQQQQQRNSYDAGYNINNNNYYYEPTLLDALSAESIHRPSVRFKFPLAGLSIASRQPLSEDWKVCFWNEIEREAAKVAAATAAPRGGFGSLQGGVVGGISGMQGRGIADEKTEEKPLGAVGKENATRILFRLLSGAPKDQLELKTHFEKTHRQRHPPQGQHHGAFGNFGSPTPLKQRSHGAMGTRMGNNLGHQMPPGDRGHASHCNEPSLELTMLEYYLFLFVRFPLANTSWESQWNDHLARQRRSSNRLAPPFGQRVHSYLFSSYLNYFLPQGRGYDERMLGVGVDCFDRCRTIETVASLDRTSELFLRLLIEFWIEGPNVAPTTHDAIARYRRVSGGLSNSSSSQAVLQPSLSDSLELAKPFHQPFISPPPQVQSGVLNFVRHLISDKSMRDSVQTVSGYVQRRQRDDRKGSPPDLVNENSNATDSIDNEGNMSSQSDSNNIVPWCLPPALTATQPSLFNYIRLGLACGAIHDRSSIFYRALETWLVWLEPWNYVMKRRAVPTRPGSGGATSGSRRAGEFLRNAAATVSYHHRVEHYPSYVQPKPTSPSTFSAQWEAYVLANAHFYTVPLAIFLERARELDFSTNAEYPRSLALVQRVLRIYSKALVNVLNSALNQRADVLSMSLFSRHKTNMGAFCPPNTWKLTECQLDATNLLEEMFSQYQKRKAAMDFFDRMEAKLNAVFDGKIGTHEATLENILSHVQYLVNLPLDYQVLPEEPRTPRGFGLLYLLGLRTKDAAAKSVILETVPERGPDGKLTDLGRQQIFTGQLKCNPFGVDYIGDPMLARVKSYEIPALVELTIGLSNYLNRKLGLSTPTSQDDLVGDTEGDALSRRVQEMEQYQKVAYRRFNLRFLADYRNIIFGTIVWWFVKTFVFYTN